MNMDVARFVGTGGFLTCYSKGYMKYANKPPIKEVSRLFLTKHYSFNLKTTTIHSRHD